MRKILSHLSDWRSFCFVPSIIVHLTTCFSCAVGLFTSCSNPAHVSHKRSGSKSVKNPYTMEPKMITHISLLFGNYFPNCTENLLHKALWQELFCVVRRLYEVLSVNAPITHINCLGINFPIARTSVTQKTCFPITPIVITSKKNILSELFLAIRDRIITGKYAKRIKFDSYMISVTIAFV